MYRVKVAGRVEFQSGPDFRQPSESMFSPPGQSPCERKLELAPSSMGNRLFRTVEDAPECHLRVLVEPENTVNPTPESPRALFPLALTSMIPGMFNERPSDFLPGS